MVKWVVSTPGCGGAPARQERPSGRQKSSRSPRADWPTCATARASDGRGGVFACRARPGTSAVSGPHREARPILHTELSRSGLGEGRLLPDGGAVLTAPSSSPHRRQVVHVASPTTTAMITASRALPAHHDHSQHPAAAKRCRGAAKVAGAAAGLPSRTGAPGGRAHQAVVISRAATERQVRKARSPPGSDQERIADDRAGR
jgi:hypothetical protein